MITHDPCNVCGSRDYCQDGSGGQLSRPGSECPFWEVVDGEFRLQERWQKGPRIPEEDQTRRKLNVWTCTDFEGFWPVGTSAVVVAHTRAEAADLLFDKLLEIGLVPAKSGREDEEIVQDLELVQVRLTQPEAIVLQDGNY